VLAEVACQIVDSRSGQEILHPVHPSHPLFMLAKTRNEPKAAGQRGHICLKNQKQHQGKDSFFLVSKMEMPLGLKKYNYEDLKQVTKIPRSLIENFNSKRS